VRSADVLTPWGARIGTLCLSIREEGAAAAAAAAGQGSGSSAAAAVHVIIAAPQLVLPGATGGGDSSAGSSVAAAVAAAGSEILLVECCIVQPKWSDPLAATAAAGAAAGSLPAATPARPGAASGVFASPAPMTPAPAAASKWGRWHFRLARDAAQPTCWALEQPASAPSGGVGGAASAAPAASAREVKLSFAGGVPLGWAIECTVCCYDPDAAAAAAAAAGQSTAQDAGCAAAASARSPLAVLGVADEPTESDASAGVDGGEVGVLVPPAAVVPSLPYADALARGLLDPSVQALYPTAFTPLASGVSDGRMDAEMDAAAAAAASIDVLRLAVLADVVAGAEVPLVPAGGAAGFASPTASGATSRTETEGSTGALGSDATAASPRSENLADASAWTAVAPVPVLRLPREEDGAAAQPASGAGAPTLLMEPVFCLASPVPAAGGAAAARLTSPTGQAVVAAGAPAAASPAAGATQTGRQLFAALSITQLRDGTPFALETCLHAHITDVRRLPISSVHADPAAPEITVSISRAEEGMLPFIQHRDHTGRALRVLIRLPPPVAPRPDGSIRTDTVLEALSDCLSAPTPRGHRVYIRLQLGLAARGTSSTVAFARWLALEVHPHGLLQVAGPASAAAAAAAAAAAGGVGGSGVGGQGEALSAVAGAGSGPAVVSHAFHALAPVLKGHKDATLLVAPPERFLPASVSLTAFAASGSSALAAAAASVRPHPMWVWYQNLLLGGGAAGAAASASAAAAAAAAAKAGGHGASDGANRSHVAGLPVSPYASMTAHDAWARVFALYRRCDVNVLRAWEAAAPPPAGRRDSATGPSGGNATAKAATEQLLTLARQSVGRTFAATRLSNVCGVASDGASSAGSAGAAASAITSAASPWDLLLPPPELSVRMPRCDSVHVARAGPDKAGYVFKSRARMGGWARRYFVLQPPFLAYYHSAACADGNQRPDAVLHLSEITVCDERGQLVLVDASAASGLASSPGSGAGRDAFPLNSASGSASNAAAGGSGGLAIVPARAPALGTSPVKASPLGFSIVHKPLGSASESVKLLQAPTPEEKHAWVLALLVAMAHSARVGPW